MNEIFNGIVLVNKPQGWSSHDLVDFARKVFGTRNVGHCGTLDPMASGLMVLLIGEATKLSNYILERDKAYRVTAKLGIATDTLDVLGATLKTAAIEVSLAKIKETALALNGEIQLPVPMYSAAKVDGQKLYEYARSGQAVEQPQKTMNFFELKWNDQGPDWVDLDLRCSKGSFIRSWVQELGVRLGCGAAMSALVRTESAPYSLSEAVSKDELQAHKEAGTLSKVLIPMNLTLPEYRAIRVNGLDETLIQNGQISHALKSQLISTFKPGVDPGVKIVAGRGGKLLALIGLEPQKGFVIRRVFRY